MPDPTPPAATGNAILDNNEPLLGLAAAGKLHGGAHPTTVQRWCNRGIRKSGAVVKLDSVRCGGRVMTSAAAVRRFFAALSDPAATPPPTPTTADRRKAAEAANRELIAAGA